MEYSQVLQDVDVLTNSGSETLGDVFEPPASRTKLSAEQRNRMLALFKHFDHDDNDFISEREIRIGLTKLGNPPTIAEAKKMVNQLDLSHGHGRDGYIDFEEFLTGIIHRRCLLFQALYCQHKLTGKPTSANEIAPNAEKLGISKATDEQEHDPRARLKQLIAKNTNKTSTKTSAQNRRTSTSGALSFSARFNPLV